MRGREGAGQTSLASWVIVFLPPSEDEYPLCNTVCHRGRPSNERRIPVVNAKDPAIDRWLASVKCRYFGGNPSSDRIIWNG